MQGPGSRARWDKKPEKRPGREPEKRELGNREPDRRKS